MAIVEFRFYEELNDFLRPEQRKRPFCHAVAERATVNTCNRGTRRPAHGSRAHHS
ncbi:MAG: hypothetical protein ACREVH_02145 [Gammaproteobacteria bacterium]